LAIWSAVVRANGWQSVFAVVDERAERACEVVDGLGAARRGPGSRAMLKTASTRFIHEAWD
jgi:hypothetical protein